jgi:hypothetical protein
MPNRSSLLVAALIGCSIAASAALVVRARRSTPTTPTQSALDLPQTPAAAEPPAVETVPFAPAVVRTPRSEPTLASATSSTPPPTSSTTYTPPRPKPNPFSLDRPQTARPAGPATPGVTARAKKPEPQAPEARAALSLVGEDDDAEALWQLAINDPTLSPDERKDLIEDLNEDGFPDPKNITPDDLPLILSRLALIEQVAPEAMDETNAAAFAEAYKDLVNMLDRLSRQ